MRYRPEIDGLRTVAVIPVVLFHLGYSLFRGGFYGVDVFFVISGYLITKILTEKIESNQFSMYEFWMRRVKRLLPLLITVTLTVLLVAPFLIFRPVIISVAKDSLPSIFSFFNVYSFLGFGDYWGASAEKSFFLHTWSLSVEEQFYLIFPFFLYFSYKWLRGFRFMIFVVIVTSFLLFVFFMHANSGFAFYMLPTRAWELLIGSACGIVQLENLRKYNQSFLFSSIGLFLVLFSFVVENGSINYMVLFAVLGSALIIIFTSSHNYI